MYNDNNVKQNHVEMLKDFREQTGFSQEAIAKSLGVRRATVSDWETGKSSAKYVLAGLRLAVLAQTHGLTLQDLILALPDMGEGFSGDSTPPSLTCNDA